jgi:hypothetical protein
LAKSTWCASSEQIEFALANGIKATGGFDGGDISGFGGAVLMSLVDDAYRFTSGAAEFIKDRRNPTQVKHTMEKLFRQAVLLCGLGHPDGIDWSHFDADPMLKLCLGWQPDGEQDAASQPSASRFMKDRSKRDILRLFSYCISSYIEKHEEAPKEIGLVFDGSAVEAHGRQQFIAFNGHYEFNCYFPLFVMDQNDWLIAPVLRPGNVSDAEITVDVLKILVKRFRRAWPKVKILLRADAAFHDPKIMDWCEANGLEFVIGLKGDNALNVGSKQFDQKAESQFRKVYGDPWFANGKEKNVLLRDISAQPKVDRRAAYAILDEREVRQSGKFQHRAGEGGNDKKRLERRWIRPRTVISSARFNDRGLKRRYLVVSDGLAAYTPDHIYNEIYSARSKQELTIRSVKELGGDRLNAQEALTNQFKLIIYAMTHNLFQLMKEVLPEALRSLSVQTLIHEFGRIPVQVKVSTRRIWLRWTSCYKHKDLVMKLVKRLKALPKPA